MQIKLIIGLGNPGKEYEFTRHNVGFLFIDELACLLNIGKCNSTIRGRSSGSRIIEKQKSKVVLAKSHVFMNKSGAAVLALLKQYHPMGDHPKGDKIKPENVLIVHDDIDILWGNFKFSFGRSSAGHKGVESIIKTLKTKNFWRLRIGIQPIRQAQGKPALKKRVKADKIILKKFTEGELKELDNTVKKAASELETALS